MSLPKPPQKRSGTRRPTPGPASKKPRLAISDGAGATESADITEVTEADADDQDGLCKRCRVHRFSGG